MRFNQIMQTIELAHSINRPLMVWGAPGVGKSSAGKQYAAAKKLRTVDWRLTMMDPVDMRGTPRSEGGYTKWSPPAELRLCEKGEGILIIDELAQARMDTKNVAAMLVLERRIGEWLLGEGWWVLSMSNRLGDAAGTSPMPTHLNNRFWHVDLDLSVPDWLTWAASADIDYRVQAYIKYFEKALLDFDPRSKDAAFASPRTWEGVSDIIKKIGEARDILKLEPEVLSEMVAGNVGKVHGASFVGFLRTMHALVSFEEALANPASAPIPQEPSVCYAVVTGLTRAVTKQTIAAAFEYVQRMSTEYAFVFARKLEIEQPELRKTAAFVKFCATHADYL